MNAKIVAVSKNQKHQFSKETVDSILLIEDYGVEGDAHAGKLIKHLYLAKKDPNRKNIRQVHLLPVELFETLAQKGFTILPGELGENITTQGIDLLAYPKGTQLHLGPEAVIELTALRNPCVQIENFKKGLLKEVVTKDDEGNIVRNAGVMAVVITGGLVKPDDAITITLPNAPHEKLEYIW